MTVLALCVAGYLTAAGLIALAIGRAIRIADSRDGNWWAAP